jgi:hypothetical protein
MQSLVKDVNSKLKASTGVSSSIHIQLDKWEDWDSFIVILMADFEVILRKELLKRTHSFLIPLIWIESSPKTFCKNVLNL